MRLTWRGAAIVALCVAALAGCSRHKPTHESEHGPTLDQAIATYLAGDGAKAFPVLQRYAEQGNRDALFYLGRAYYEGQGAPPDNSRAAEDFVKASAGDKGDPNWAAAPVWAGLAYERLNDWDKAAAMHRLALQRFPHITSMIDLGRMIRLGFIPGSPIASTRYFASAQAVRDGLGSAEPPFDYLATSSCFELMQAAFVEEKSADPTSSLSYRDFSKDLLACASSGDRSKLRHKLVAAAALRLKTRKNGALDERATVFTFLKAKPDSSRRFLPSPFKGYVAFASDADSDEISASLSGQRFLNDHLGLPIANSAFPMAIAGANWPYEGKVTPQKTGFYTGLDDVTEKPVAGLPEFFALARAWHHGRYDHFHSWYSDCLTMLYRASAAIKGGLTVALTDFFGKLPRRYHATGQVVRLYFSEKPPVDTRLLFKTRDGVSFAVNSADLVSSERTELDEGKQRDVVVLRFPARFPQFALDPRKAIAFDDIESLRIESPSCQADCKLVLEKIETNVFDRDSAIAQARLFRRLNVYPYGYTSHGGESWQVHGDPKLLDAFWEKLAADTSEPGKTYISPTFPLANIAESKGYIENLLSEIGIRAVRPERAPDDRPNIHDWDAPSEVFGLYRDKMIFSSTYFDGDPPQGAPLGEKQKFLLGRLKGLKDEDELVAKICTAQNCNLAQNATLAALVYASLLKAKKATGFFSHLWYTHFGAPTPALTPTPEKPFTDTAKLAFERLAEAQYGLTPDGGQTQEPRVLVTSPTTTLRARKLRYEVDGDLIGIDRHGDKIDISTGIDPFLGGPFPATGHADRDLGNLTFPVANVFDADVEIDGRPLAVVRRRAKPDSDAGEVSIVDDEKATTMIYGASANEPITRLALNSASDAPGVLKACAPPSQVTSLFNVTHLAFENPFYASQTAGDLEFELFVRTHPQQAFGLDETRLKRHVFTANPATVEAGAIGTTVHAIDLPRTGGRQPKDVIVDLTRPARYLPAQGSTQGSIGDLNVDGLVEKLCVSIKQPAGASPTAFGPLKFLSPTTSDGPKYPAGLLAGGAIAGAAALQSQPAALRFTRAGSQDAVSMALDDGFYFGKLPGPGFYRVRLVAPSCESSPETDLLIEHDRLDIDLDIAGCALKESAARQ
jgi:hypothetical protein